jgi:hypothetical protein
MSYILEVVIDKYTNAKLSNSIPDEVFLPLGPFFHSLYHYLVSRSEETWADGNTGYTDTDTFARDRFSFRAYVRFSTTRFPDWLLLLRRVSTDGARGLYEIERVGDHKAKFMQNDIVSVPGKLLRHLSLPEQMYVGVREQR